MRTARTRNLVIELPNEANKFIVFSECLLFDGSVRIEDRNRHGPGHLALWLNRPTISTIRCVPVATVVSRGEEFTGARKVQRCLLRRKAGWDDSARIGGGRRRRKALLLALCKRLHGPQQSATSPKICTDSQLIRLTLLSFNSRILTIRLQGVIGWEWHRGQADAA